MLYRVFHNHQMAGPYTVSELQALAHFSADLLVCPDGEMDWRPVSQFPALLQREPEPVTLVEESLPRPRDWRHAVIGGDIPEMRYRAWRPAETSAADRAPAPSQPLVVPEEPVVWKQRARLAVEFLQQRRKAVLMSVLWTVALGMYSPQTDNLLAIYQGLSFPVEIRPVAGRAWRKHTASHRGPWHPLNYFRRPAQTAKAAVAPANRGSLSPAPIEEPTGEKVIALDDLGDGTLLKTVVIVRIVDGLRIEETKTYVVSKHAAHRHAPARTHKAKGKAKKLSQAITRSDFIL